MAAHYVLLLDAQGLRAYQRQGGAMNLDVEFAANANGHEAFASYLAKQRGCLFHLLVNIAEEGFQLEEIPYLRGRDRKAVIQRKLGQSFFGTRFGTALPQGRSPEGRRDERVLMMSLTRPQLIEPWLAALESAEALLAGIVSLPQVLANLAAIRARPRCLLVTATRGGLRQTFFDNGHLSFSRLTPWNGDTSTTYTHETERLQQYLAGQRLVARDEPLPVFVVLPAAKLNAWREQFHDTATLRFECLDFTAVTSRDDDALYAQLLLQHRPRQQLAPDAARQPLRRWQVKRALMGASATICAACLSFAALQFSTALRLGKEAADQRAHNEATARALQKTLDTQGPTPLTLPRLRDLVARYDELRQGAPGPMPLLQRLGTVLTDFPQIELERLSWSVGGRFESEVAGRFAIIEIEARLPPETASDPRGNIATVNGFIERLRADPALRVRISDTAFEAASDKVMRGGDAETVEPQFSLRVAQRL